jgi:hypothetical protein
MEFLIKLSFLQRNANAELMKSRGRLEPRTVIGFCESSKLRSLGIQHVMAKDIRGKETFDRSLTWQKVWNSEGFKDHQATAKKAPSLASAADPSKEFGLVVSAICASQNTNVHSLRGNSVVIPSGFDPDQKIVMRSLCEFVPIDCEDE